MKRTILALWAVMLYSGIFFAQFEPLSVSDVDPLIQFRAPVSYPEMLHDGLAHIVYALQDPSIWRHNHAILIDMFVKLMYTHDSVLRSVNRSDGMTRTVDRDFFEQMLHKIDNLIEMLEDENEEVRSGLKILHKNLRFKVLGS